MSLLRRVRVEWSGALRSVRYDLGRRPIEPPSGGPDMTSTGMNTFGGVGLGIEEPAAKPKARMPRRAVLVTALGVLTVLAAAGAYLGVVDGLGSLLNTSQAEAGTVPSAPGETNSGIGGDPTTTKNPLKPADVPPAMVPTTPAPAGVAAPANGTTDIAPTATMAQKTSPIRTINPPKGECACGSIPPVPTPTVPQSAPEPSESPYPSDSADPSPSATSATPSDSVTPSDSPQARHRRRHH